MLRIEDFLTPEELQANGLQQGTQNTMQPTQPMQPQMSRIEDFLTPEEKAANGFSLSPAEQPVNKPPTVGQGLMNVGTDIYNAGANAIKNLPQMLEQMFEAGKQNLSAEGIKQTIPALAEGIGYGAVDTLPNLGGLGVDLINSYHGYEAVKKPELLNSPFRRWYEAGKVGREGAWETDKAAFSQGLGSFLAPGAAIGKVSKASKLANATKVSNAQKAAALEKATRKINALDDVQKAKYARQIEKIKQDYKTPEQILAEAEKNRTLGRRILDETTFGAATGATEGENLEERMQNAILGGAFGAGGTLGHAGISKGLKSKPVASALTKAQDATNKFIDNHENIAKGVGFIDNAMNLNAAQGKAKKYSELYKKASDSARFERTAGLDEKAILELANNMSPEEYKQAVDYLKKGDKKLLEEQRIENIKEKARRQKAKKEQGEVLYDPKQEQQVDNTNFVKQIFGDKKSKEAEEILAKKEAFEKLSEKRKELYSDNTEPETIKNETKTKEQKQKEKDEFWDSVFNDDIEELNELAYGSKADNISSWSEKNLLRADDYKQRQKGTAKERTTILEPESREFNPEKSVNRITSKKEDYKPEEININPDEKPLLNEVFIDQMTGKRVGAVEPNSGKLKDDFVIVRKRHNGYLVRRRSKEELQALKENKQDNNSIQRQLEHEEERKNWRDYQRQELINEIKKQNEDYYNNDVEDRVENVNKDFIGHGFQEEKFESNGRRFSDRVINDEMTPREKSRGVKFMRFVDEMEHAKEKTQQRLYDDFYDSLEKQSDKDWFTKSFQEHTFENVNKNRIRTKSIENENAYNKAKKLESDFIESSPSRKERSNEIEFGEDDFKAYNKRRVKSALDALRMFLNEKAKTINNNDSTTWNENLKAKYKSVEKTLETSPEQASDLLVRAFKNIKNKQELYDTIYGNLNGEYNKNAIRAIVREINQIAREYDVKMKGSGRLINNQTKYSKAFDVLEKAIEWKNAKGAKSVFKLFDNKLHKKYGLSAKQRETIHEAYYLETTDFLNRLNKDKSKFTDKGLPVWERDKIRKKYVKEYENMKRVIKNSLTDWEQKEITKPIERAGKGIKFNEEGLEPHTRDSAQKMYEGTGDVFDRQQSGVKEQPYVKVMSEIESILNEVNPRVNKYKVKNTQKDKLSSFEKEREANLAEIKQINEKLKGKNELLKKEEKELLRIKLQKNTFLFRKQRTTQENIVNNIKEDIKKLKDRKLELEDNNYVLDRNINDFNTNKNNIDYESLRKDINDVKNGIITEDLLGELKQFVKKRKTYGEYKKETLKNIQEGKSWNYGERLEKQSKYYNERRKKEAAQGLDLQPEEYAEFERVFKKQKANETLTEADKAVVENYKEAVKGYLFDDFSAEVERAWADRGLKKYIRNKQQQHSYQKANDYFNGKSLNDITVEEGTHLDFLDGLNTYTNSTGAVIEAIDNFARRSNHKGVEGLPIVLNAIKDNVKTTFKPIQLLNDILNIEPESKTYSSFSELPVSEKLKVMFSFEDVGNDVFGVVDNLQHSNGKTIREKGTKNVGSYVQLQKTKEGNIDGSAFVRTTAHELGHNFLRKHPEYADMFGLTKQDLIDAAEANTKYNDFLETDKGKLYSEYKNKTVEELRALPEDVKEPLRKAWTEQAELRKALQNTKEEIAVSNFAKEIVDLTLKNKDNTHVKRQGEIDLYERAKQYENQFGRDSRPSDIRGNGENGSRSRIDEGVGNSEVRNRQIGREVEELNELNNSFDDFIAKANKKVNLPNKIKTYTDYIKTVSKTTEDLLLKHKTMTPESIKAALKKFGSEDGIYFKQFFGDKLDDYTPEKTGLLGTKKTEGKGVHGNATQTVIANAQRMINFQHAETVVEYLKQNFGEKAAIGKSHPDNYIPVNSDILWNAIAFKKSNKWLETLSKGETAMKEAFSETDYNEFKGLVDRAGSADIYLPKEALEAILDGSNESIAQYFNNYVKGRKVDTKFIAKISGAFLDFTNNQFKKAVLSTGSFFTNNRIGNQIMLAAKSGTLKDYVEGMYKALKAKDNVPSEIITSLLLEACENFGNKRRYTGYPEVDNLLNLMDGHLYDLKNKKGLTKTAALAANGCIGLPNKAYNKLVEKLMNLNEKFERFERKQAYFQEVAKAKRDGILKTGSKALTIEELLEHIDENPNLKEYIVDKVNDVLGDYNNFSNAEKKVFKRIIPFYSWHRTIFRHTLKLAKENPTRFGLIAMKLYLINNRDDGRPDWQRGVLEDVLGIWKPQKGYVVNKKGVIPYATIGQDLTKVKGLIPGASKEADGFMGDINPSLKVAYEAAIGKKTFAPASEITHRNWKRVTKDGKQGYFNKKTGKFQEGTPADVRFGYLGKETLKTVFPAMANPSLQGVLSKDEWSKKGKLPDKMYDASFGGYYNKEYIGKFEGKKKFRNAKMELPLKYQIANRVLGTGIQKDLKEEEKLKKAQEKYKNKRKKK